MGLIRLYQDQNGQQTTGVRSRIRLYSDPLPDAEEQAKTQRDVAVEEASRDVLDKKGFRAASEFVQKQKVLTESTISEKPEKKPPLGFLGRAVMKTYETAKGIINDAVERVGDFVDSILDEDGVPLNYVQENWAIPTKERKEKYLAEGNKPITPVTRIGRAINAGIGGANIAFVPVTSAFAGAEEIPGLKYPVKAVGWGFEKMGQAGAFIGSKAIDILPISDEAKNEMRQPMAEAGALVVQLLGARLGAKAVKSTLGKIKSKIVTKTHDTIADKGTVSTNDAKIITSEVIKEVPIESKGTVVFNTQGGKVPVQTDQRLVLENFLKGREDIKYRQVKKLGLDTSGNPVAARFEWDYKAQKATIYTTSKTTASNLAHELGHYFDQKLSLGIAERFSQILPEYKTYRPEIKMALTGYAVDTLGGEATPAKINSTITKLVDSFNKDISKLSAGEQRVAVTERFATAVRNVITDPVQSTQVAPEFTKFVQYFSDKKGILPSLVQEATKNVERPAAIKTPVETIKEIDLNKVPDTYNGRPVMEIENANLPLPNLMKKLQVAVEGKEDPALIKLIREDVKARAVIEATQKTPKTSKKVSQINEPTKTTKNAIIETPAIPEGKTTQMAIKTQPRAGKGGKTGVVEGRFGSTGLKTGKTVEGRKSYNPEKINAPEDVQRLIEGTSEMSGEFSKQRISKTNDDVRALAQEVGVTPEDLIKLKPGSIANAETTFKARQILADLALDLRETIRSVTTETATKEQLMEVKQKLFRLQGTMKAVAGLRTESSNVFRQFQAEVMPGELDIMTDLVSQLKKLDGKAGDDLAAFIKGSKDLLEPTYADKAWHLWYMSILSGASTQVKNVGGNLSNMLGEVAVEAATNPKGFTNSMAGLYEGLINGFGEAKRIMREGDISKFEERGQKPIHFTLGAEKALGISKMLRQTGAKVLNAADYVGRFMSAMDVWARTGFKGWEIRAQARQIGMREGLSGEQLASRIEELTAKPIEEMIEASDQFGARGTYTQKPTGVLGAFAEGVNKITRKVPALRVVVPFTRIVANVTNNSLDWTPLGFKRALLPEGTFKTLGKLAKGEKVEWLKPRARNQQLGRAVLGTAAMVYFGSLAAENMLSGNGPANSDHRAQLEATGWRRNSIKIGDRWYPYQNWGPMAIPMTIVGNYFDFTRYEKQNADAGERMTAALLNTPNSILDMSFLSGASDLVTAVQNIGRGGEQYFKRWAAQQITSPVPNLIKQTARYFDAGQYDTKTLKEQILYNLRVTTGLKPRLNVFGDPMKGEPLTQLQPGPSPDDELVKYLAGNELWVSVPSKATKIKPPGLREPRPMTEDEYYDYVKLSGIEIRKQLTRYMGRLRNMPEQKRQDFIDEVVQDIRAKVKRGIEIKGKNNQ